MAMSKHFPTLTPAAHASVYVEGIQDEDLRKELNLYRRREKGCNDLDTLIRVAMNYVNSEVGIIQERLRHSFAPTAQRREDERRMRELHQLLGSSSSYSGPGSRVRQEEGGSDSTKPPPKPKPAPELKPRTHFKDHNDLRQYMQQPCRLHPSGIHTNALCRNQRDFLAQKATKVFAAPAYGLAATSSYDAGGGTLVLLTAPALEGILLDPIPLATTPPPPPPTMSLATTLKWAMLPRL